MSKKTKLTKKTWEIIVNGVLEGCTITDVCELACIGRSTYYKWLSDYPDFNKAVVEATDLQWKYASWRVKHGCRRYRRRRLNRPSKSYQSPGNVPFAIPAVEPDPTRAMLDELSDDDALWLIQSINNAY
ncbi:hypothetical protein IKF03_03360 [Candidatus Saccharibacteria bacterium]|nr:hypothetical protein [Candidatus Saccharibacteria bacterium]